MRDSDFGEVKITLKKVIEKRKISKTKLSQRAFLQSHQLNNYYFKRIQRPDLAVLARMCYVLDCTIPDLLVYVPPESKEEGK